MLSYILVLGGVQGLILSLVILVKEKHFASRFLAAFIGMLALGCFFDNSLNFINVFYHVIFWAGNSFLIAPLLYLYAKFTVHPNDRPHETIKFFIPFVVIKSIVLISYVYDDSHHELWIIVGAILNFSLIIYNLLYIYSSYKLVKDKLSKHENANYKQLILTLLGVFTFYNIVFLIRRVSDLFFRIETSFFENYLYLGVVFLIYGISAIIIYRPEVLQRKKKYQKSSMSEERIAEHGEAIRLYFASTKSYTQSDYNLEALSTHLNLKKHQVSQIISEHFGITFYELLNQYRIEEVCHRIRSGDTNKWSILGIAFDCGYQSKSSFNNAFKRINGITPTEFEKRNRNKKSSD